MLFQGRLNLVFPFICKGCRCFYQHVLSTLKVVSKKIEPPPALEIQGLKAVSINTFCPIGPNCYEAGNDNDIIDISASLSDDKTHCTITFTNTGTLPDIKIPKEFRQICTKDFYYPDDINILSMAFYTTKPGHFGLGLFIANIVCLNHDGCLDVTHDDAHTSFHLSFAI